MTTGLRRDDADGYGVPQSTSSLRPVANLCTAGSCPTVYVDGDSGTLVVQGFDVSETPAGIEVPAGERLVRIPLDLLREAARNLS